MFEGLKKQRDRYEMSEEQFTELRHFYERLGFSDKQVKKLAANCFGADVKISKNQSYSPNWTFVRRSAPMQSGGIFRTSSSMNQFFAGSAAPMRSCMAFESAVDACMDYDEGGVFSQAAIAPSENVLQRISALEKSMSSAETRLSQEQEEHSPIDTPQCIFSANVNAASWSYLRSMIRRGRNIDRSFVRIEEIINSYPYTLALPDNGDLFSVSTEISDCPWNDDAELFFVGLKGKKSDESVRQNLAFLVDVSGSMESNWILVQMSIAAVISRLKKGDTISIISYSNETTTVAKQIDGGDVDKCVDAILSIDGIGGCTYGSDGMEKAYAYLKEYYGEDANNRVFIFTDGDFNFGLTSEGQLKDFIYEKRKTGIYLSVVGYGENNFKDNKMETLARNGNGNYNFITNPDDIFDSLWEKLVSNLVTVAKDVKISIEFNPKYVCSYRLIGYDSRGLTQKEFNDTEKAVDGIGSEHNVAALIEFKKGEAKQTYSHRYVSATVDSSDEFAFIEIHYKSPDGENLVMTKPITLGDIEKSKPLNLGAATLLAAFGLLVKDSEYKGSLTKKMLSEILKRTQGSLADGYQAVIEKYLN